MNKTDLFVNRLESLKINLPIIHLGLFQTEELSDKSLIITEILEEFKDIIIPNYIKVFI